MNLTSHIKDLLYRYDCVIVPDFGGFVTQEIGASFHKKSNTFFPPKKRISFNHLLNKNDGLLINYVSSAENISYDKASNAISLLVIKWKSELQEGSVNLDDVGVFRLNENQQIIFEPASSTNYLTQSFGLSNVEAKYAVRPKEKVIPIQAIAKEKESKKGIPSFIKYAATAAILLALGYTTTNLYQQKQQEVLLTNQQEAVKKKIQSATFEIKNPLPVLELNVVKEVAKPYHIVAGAFQFPENAKKKKTQLVKKGYDAKIIGLNEWGLTQVVFNSFSNRNDAINYLNKIRKVESKDAWLLTKN